MAALHCFRWKHWTWEIAISGVPWSSFITLSLQLEGKGKATRFSRLQWWVEGRRTMAEPLNLTCCGKRSLVLIEQGDNWLWQGSERMGLSQNKQRQWRAMVWTEKKDLNEKQKGKGLTGIGGERNPNGDKMWYWERSWSWRVRKEEQGGKRNLELRGKRVGYSDEVKNKLFHSLLW